jgi:ribonuclease HI
MAKTPKFYVVWKGRKTGIFDNWEECSDQVTGYEGAQYKSFERLAQAQEAFSGKYEDYKGKSPLRKVSQPRLLAVGKPNMASWAVDASCSGNPGDLEYRCVDVTTGREVFRKGPFEQGTNNIGEFLAIVDALALLKERKNEMPLYSDANNAISWVRARRCRTNLARNAKNEPLFALIAKAERWLATNQYDTPILKWETDVWGEIPADFGRK